MTQMSKMGPWFSPRAVGSGFGEPRSKDPTYALSAEAESRQKKSSRKAKWVPTETWGGGWSKDGPVPTHHAPITRGHDSCGNLGGQGVKMSHDSLTNFASCQSSQAKPRPRDSWDL